MRPINFEQANKRFNPPAGTRPGEVTPVMAYMPPDRSFILTCWVPTREELEALNRGAAIVLHVLSNQLPPVSLTVQDQVEIPGAVHAPVGDYSQTRCGLSIDAPGSQVHPLPGGHTWTKEKDWVTCPKCLEGLNGKA